MASERDRELSIMLQKKTQTVAGTRVAVKEIMERSLNLRKDDRFHRLWVRAQEKCAEYQLKQPSAPRSRKPPKKLEHTETPAEPHQFTPEEHFKRIYFEAIDLVVSELERRFDQSGYSRVAILEGLLLKSIASEKEAEISLGRPDCEACLKVYTEVDRRRLELQLRMVSGIEALHNCRSLQSVASEFAKLPEQTRGLFGEVDRLLRILLVIPTSNATSERSFSTLRRLKTWMRTTMTQNRLNNCVLLHVHQQTIDAVDLHLLCRQFVSLSEYRHDIFGNF